MIMKGKEFKLRKKIMPDKTLEELKQTEGGMLAAGLRAQNRKLKLIFFMPHGFFLITWFGRAGRILF